MPSQITTFSPYNDNSVGSFFFDGTQVVKAADSDDFHLGSGEWTIEFWVYFNSVASVERIAGQRDSSASAGSNGFVFEINTVSPSGYMKAYLWYGSNPSDSDYFSISSSAPQAGVWYHIAIVRDGDTIRGWTNGINSGNTLDWSSKSAYNANGPLGLGAQGTYPDDKINAYITDFRIVKGDAIYTGTGNFTPPTTALSSISGTGYSTGFLAQPGNNANLNRDTAAPEEAIIPVYNSARIPAVTSITYTNDNTTASITTGTAAYTQYYSNAKFSPSSGKYYFEARLTAPPISTPNFSSAGVIGFLYTPFEDGTRSLGQTASPAGEFALALNSGNKVESGSPSASYSSGFTNNQVFQFALDTESGSIWFGRDGTWLESGNPTTGANPTYTGANANALYFGIQGYAGTNYGGTSHLNMGQNPTFNGTESPSGGTNSDGSYPDISGIGSFLYEPPTGYKAPSTLVPTRASGLNKAALAPEKNFGTLLYEGTAADGHRIRGLNFKPDLVWLKSRSGAFSHFIFDSVRGVHRDINANATDAEASSSTYLQSFNDDGFTVGTGGGSVNQDGGDIVAWCWKAGGEPVVNTDGTITSMVSANKDAGFSIVLWTGSDTTDSVGHGLNQAPELYFNKSRTDGTKDWIVGTTLIDGSMDYSRLNTTNTFGTYGVTLPTSSVFNTASGAGNTGDMIAYCWHSVPGFSKFGSYTGNGSTDGPFVYTGFRPAWLMVKRTDAADHWFIVDVARDKINVMGELILANSSGTPTDSDHFDFISNGFKIRNTGAGINASSGTYIFMAIAETPSGFTNSR